MFDLLFGIACLIIAYWLVLYIRKKDNEAFMSFVRWQEMEYLKHMSELAAKGNLPESEFQEGMTYFLEDNPSRQWRTIGFDSPFKRIVERNTPKMNYEDYYYAPTEEE